MSVGAVLDGRNDIAVGNVVGSNIFNVLFILGISALITPLVCESATDPAGGADHDRRLVAAAGPGVWTAASACGTPRCWPR